MTSMDDKVWSINIKRSMLSMFNVNIEKRNAVVVERMPQQMLIESNPIEIFKVVEPSVGGECETLYTIEKKMPINKLDVKKVVDYNKCSKRPIDIRSMWESIKRPEGVTVRI